MRLRPAHAITALALCATGASGARSTGPAAPSTIAHEHARVATSLAKLPLRFEANAGQLDPRVRYVARASGLSLFLTDDGATLISHGGSAVTMRVVGRARETTPVGTDALLARSSYFIGSDPARWRTDVPSFRRVTYEDVLPGVHQVFHGEAGALEYDFVVRPGARPDSIELAFEGADRVALDANGNLVIHTPAGALVEPRPRVYERADGQELAVAAAYRVTGERTVAFDVGAYDAAKTLVIDPVLAYSTYLGGDGSDYGYGITVDGAGAMYVTGFTTSTNFPTAHPYDATYRGADDVFVTKLSPTGTELVYSTYLGGSASADGYGVAVDASGAAYVVGSTSSPDFPTTSAFQSSFGGIDDAFVAKLSPSGDALVYSTFLGGSQRDYGYGIAVDSSGAAYIAGSTYSTDFPVVKGAAQSAFGGATDAFVSKLGPTGALLVYSTYLGGSAVDEGRGIAVDSTGAAYVAGYSASLDFPTAPAMPFQGLIEGTDNAIVTKVSASGDSFVYSTYLGGSESDEASAIAVDATGAAYVTGFATSPDFPTTAHTFQADSASTDGSSEAFVTKLDTTGTALAYSTFLGGSGGDVGQGVAIDGVGQAYVTGFTASSDFPVTSAFQSTNASSATAMGTNAFAAAFTAAGSALVYSTYLGGSISDSAQAIAVGAVDAGSAAYVTGYTVSPDFPTRDPLQAHLASEAGDNAFVAVIAGQAFADAGATDAGASGVVDSGLLVGFGDAAEPGVDASSATVPATAGGGACTCRTGAPAARSGARGPVWALGGALALVVLRRRRRRGPAARVTR